MASNYKAIKEGKYIGLYLNTDNGTMEIWQVYKGQYECWDTGITNREEALEVWRYGEKHYTDGLL